MTRFVLIKDAIVSSLIILFFFSSLLSFFPSMKLDYCSSLLNLREIDGRPNYKFVKGDIQSADLVNRTVLLVLF